MIEILNAKSETFIFLLILIGALIFTFSKTNNVEFMGKELSKELKGFAMLAIIFGHIGYAFSSDKNFLFPISVWAGAGVNMFLLLSGFGLTTSAIQKEIWVIEFYKKRLLKLFIPLWIIIIIFLLLDYFLNNKSYLIQSIIFSFLGWIPRADTTLDINSPLWYFSFILFYYLLFPIIFRKRFALISTILIFIISLNFFKYDLLDVSVDLKKMYLLHNWAFPLGMLFAVFINSKAGKLLENGFSKYKELVSRKPLILMLNSLFVAAGIYVFAYIAIYSSGVGDQPFVEQYKSILTVFVLIIIFHLIDLRSKLFGLFGEYSYEIYLLHWPILARFDVFYKFLPGSTATILTLFLFVLLAILLRGEIFHRLKIFNRKEKIS